MAVAMYDVKKCRSICCHKSLSERFVLQSPFGVVVAAIVVALSLLFYCCGGWRSCDVTNITLALPTEAGTLDL